MKFNVVTEDHLQQVLQTKFFGRTAYTFQAIDSTNRFAKKIAVQGAQDGTLVYAEKQSSGYGRRQNKWSSPSGQGLWFSVVLKPVMEADSFSLLTLLGVTSVAMAVEKHIQAKLQVKWPNDLLINKKKLAGILVETNMSGQKAQYAVLGIGINVNQEMDDFPRDIQNSATSLKIAGWPRINRTLLLSDILFQLEKDYYHSQSKGFDFVLSRWITRSSVLNQNVGIRVNGRILHGKVTRFHAKGDLVLVLPGGREERVSDGTIVEVSNDSGY